MIRYAIRSLRSTPLFSSVVFVSMTLGIAACTLALSIAEAASFHPRLFGDQDHLVVIMETTSTDCQSCLDTFSSATFESWLRADPHSFISLAAYQPVFVELDGDDGRRATTGAVVTSRFFPTLGVHPFLGRPITSERETAGSDREAVISYGLWQEQFGGRSDAIGRNIRANETSYIVVGVMARGFSYPSGTRIWLATHDRAAPGSSDARTLMAVGRLAPGATVEMARAELQVLASRAQLQDPVARAGRGISVESFETSSRQNVRSGHWLLVGAVCFTFLIACANVASLYLLRALSRSREIAIRVALGAGLRQVGAQLLVESLLLTLTGGVAGILLAAKLVSTISAIVESRLGLPVVLQLDGYILAMAVILSCVVGVAFGLAPLVQLRRPDQTSVLRGTGGGLTRGWRERRLRGVLVGFELAIVVILSAGAVLFSRSYLNMEHFDIGFDASRVVLARPRLRLAEYQEPQQLRRLSSDLLARLAHVSGAKSSALWSTYFLPRHFQGSRLSEAPLTVEGYGEVMEDRAAPILSLDGTPGMLATLGIHVIRGRDFAPSDDQGAPPVAIVNKVAADEYWPGQDPVGKQLKFGPATSDSPWLTVIGVTDAKVLPHTIGLGLALINPDRKWPQVYRPFAQAPSANIVVAVRAGSEPGRMISQLRGAVEESIGSSPDAEYGTLRALMNQSWKFPMVQLKAAVLVGFALVSIGLALIGVHSMAADAVQQRAQEFGIRVALGARPAAIIWLVTREALMIALGGVVVGLFGTVLLVMVAGHLVFGITAVLKNGLLFGVSATDPVNYVVVCIALVLVVLMASLGPALRAIRVKPVSLLSSE